MPGPKRLQPKLRTQARTQARPQTTQATDLLVRRWGLLEGLDRMAGMCLLAITSGEPPLLGLAEQHLVARAMGDEWGERLEERRIETLSKSHFDLTKSLKYAKVLSI